MIPSSANCYQQLKKLLADIAETRDNEQREPLLLSFVEYADNTQMGACAACRVLAETLHSDSVHQALTASYVLMFCFEQSSHLCRTELLKFRFLNELIKLLSPRHLAAKTAPIVRRRVADILFSWRHNMAADAKLMQAYSMIERQDLLKQNGIVPRLISASDIVDISTDPVTTREHTPSAGEGGLDTKRVLSTDQCGVGTSRAGSAIEDATRGALLKRLLHSRHAEDLAAANDLIRSMVREDEAIAELDDRRVSELQVSRDSGQLLSDMLARYSAISSTREECDVMSQLYHLLISKRQQLDQLAAAADDDQLSELVNVADFVAGVVDRYTAVIGSSDNSTVAGNTAPLYLLQLDSHDSSPTTTKTTTTVTTSEQQSGGGHSTKWRSSFSADLASLDLDCNQTVNSVASSDTCLFNSISSEVAPSAGQLCMHYNHLPSNSPTLHLHSSDLSLISPPLQPNSPPFKATSPPLQPNSPPFKATSPPLQPDSTQFSHTGRNSVLSGAAPNNAPSLHHHPPCVHGNVFSTPSSCFTADCSNTTSPLCKTPNSATSVVGNTPRQPLSSVTPTISPLSRSLNATDSRNCSPAVCADNESTSHRSARAKSSQPPLFTPHQSTPSHTTSLYHSDNQSNSATLAQARPMNENSDNAMVAPSLGDIFTSQRSMQESAVPDPLEQLERMFRSSWQPATNTNALSNRSKSVSRPQSPAASPIGRPGSGELISTNPVLDSIDLSLDDVVPSDDPALTVSPTITSTSASDQCPLTVLLYRTLSRPAANVAVWVISVHNQSYTQSADNICLQVSCCQTGVGLRLLNSSGGGHLVARRKFSAPPSHCQILLLHSVNQMAVMLRLCVSCQLHTSDGLPVSLSTEASIELDICTGQGRE